ncbi:MAG: GTPase HflX [Proteobacteria bacterium]|nr:GTPase HflX [Pseudomonadota bacterium]
MGSTGVVEPADSELGERTLLVHQRSSRLDDLEDLDELELLASSAGANVIGTVLSRRQRPEPATYIGKGKVEELAEYVKAEDIELVLVNHDLSPVQERNLEKMAGCRVLDRTGLILDIFAQRARSHEGKLQVELAQLEHLSTRLVRGWTHLERQKGGIGLRGPGETQLESDRRLLRDRIKYLNKRIKRVSNQRQIRRKSRNKIPIPTVSLVGYTNAGKSSLFNQITGAGIYAADQLFATLDPTMRRVDLPGNTEMILADTVGFIRHLPHDLVEAFKSTLEEVQEANLLLHVVDAANPDYQDHEARVHEVLTEIDAENVDEIKVYNKIDLTEQSARIERDDQGVIRRIWLSAHTGEGVDLLIEALGEHFRGSRKQYRLLLPPQAGRLRAQVYEQLEVLNEQPTEAGGWLIEISADERGISVLRKQNDFHDDYLEAVDETVLAPTGSCP